jgi:hypothetical protein
MKLWIRPDPFLSELTKATPYEVQHGAARRTIRKRERQASRAEKCGGSLMQLFERDPQIWNEVETAESSRLFMTVSGADSNI